MFRLLLEYYGDCALAQNYLIGRRLVNGFNNIYRDTNLKMADLLTNPGVLGTPGSIPAIDFDCAFA